MPRYYFNLQNGTPFEDSDGLDLPNLAAARDEATGFARDMMRNKPNKHDWSDWIVRVEDENRKRVFELPFVEAAR